MFVNTETNEESVVVKKMIDPEYEQEEDQIVSSMNFMKSIKSKNSKGSLSARITRIERNFRVNSAPFLRHTGFIFQIMAALHVFLKLTTNTFIIAICMIAF